MRLLFRKFQMKTRIHSFVMDFHPNFDWEADEFTCGVNVLKFLDTIRSNFDRFQVGDHCSRRYLV